MMKGLSLQKEIAIPIFLIAFWLAANPYIGIDHDARLYVLMALHWISPGSYALDPWFSFGSQDRWSIFSPLLGAVFAALGVANGAMVATLLQAVLFSLAALSLGRAVFGGKIGSLVGLVLTSIPLLYSPRGMLFLTEGFVTARGFAVPLALLGLAFALKKRCVIALLLCFMAMAIHPIMAFAPTALVILLLVPGGYPSRLVGLGWCGAALLFIAGHLGYVETVDCAWLKFAYPAFLVFIDQWFFGDLPNQLLFICALLAASFFSPQPRCRLYRMTLLVVASCVAISYVAASVPILVFLRAQFWRAMWLLKLLALVAMVDLILLHIIRSRSRYRRGKLLALLGGANLAIVLPWVAFSGVFLLGLIPQRVRQWLMTEAEKFPRVLAIGSVSMVVLLLPHYWYGLISSGFFMNEEGQELALGALRTGGLGIFAVIAWLLVMRKSRWPALFVAVILLILTGSLWDSRSDQQKGREAKYHFPSDKSGGSRVVPQGSVVYWHGNPEQVWFVLGTSGYASTTHATGLIFSRERTLLLAERLRRVVMAGNLDWRKQSKNATDRLSVTSAGSLPPFETDVLASYERAAHGIEKKEALVDLCMDKSLDYVVARGKFDFLEGPAREAREIIDNGNKFYLYRCHSAG